MADKERELKWFKIFTFLKYISLEPIQLDNQGSRPKKYVFWGKFSQMCEILENERWNSGKKRRFLGWFGGVLGRFGTQPPHPPIFGTNVPKKRVFFRLPLRDTDSAHFKMHFRFGKLLQHINIQHTTYPYSTVEGNLDGKGGVFPNISRVLVE